MELTFDLLLTLLVEIPIIAFFFKRRKRQPAVIVGLIVNIATWPIFHYFRFKYPDLDIIWIKAGIAVIEAAAYWYFLGRNWKKAILISLVANGASFLVTSYIKFPADAFMRKPNMIR